MTEHKTEHPLSHEELKYREHLQRGLDFTKIELFRSAREEFKFALSYRPDDRTLEERVDYCNKKIKQDTRKVITIVPIVLAIIVVVILLV